MAVTVATFKIRFPEFASIEDEVIQMFIDDSSLFVNENIWDTKYDLGVSYRAAHELAIYNNTSAGNSEASGPITGQSVDGVSISFGSSNKITDETMYLSSTIYGQKYLAMRKTLGIGAYIV